MSWIALPMLGPDRRSRYIFDMNQLLQPKG